jgi:site-specific recombinase XerD
MFSMATIKVRYFVEKKGARGSRFFWQPSEELRAEGWRLQRLPDERTAAIAAAEDWNHRLDDWRAGAAPDGAPKATKAKKAPARPGSVAALRAEYERSDDFQELKPRTKRAYRQQLATIEAWAGDELALAVTRTVVQARYKARREATPSMAAAEIRVLQAMFSWGARNGWRLPENPAAKQKLRNTAKKGKLWTPAAVKAFAAKADEKGWHSVGTAAILNEWIGQRPTDLIALPLNIYHDGVLGPFDQSKTGAGMELPVDMVPALAERLSAELARRAEAVKKWKVTPTTLLVCESTGRAWDEHHLRHVVADIRAECPEAEGLVLRYLRHTAVTRLAEAGCELPQIAGVTGHSIKSVEAIIDRYLIRRRRLAAQAFKQRLQAESEGQ